MIYEYGAMSSKYSIEADNKLTAYAAIIIQFYKNPFLVAIYAPEECKSDSWLMRIDDLEARLDEIFGGEKGAFQKYLAEHDEEIGKACKTVKQLI